MNDTQEVVNKKKRSKFGNVDGEEQKLEAHVGTDLDACVQGIRTTTTWGH